MVLRTFNFWGFCGPYRESPYYFGMASFNIFELVTEAHCSKTIFYTVEFRISAHFCNDSADLYSSSRFSATFFAEPCRKNSQRLKTWAPVVTDDPPKSHRWTTEVVSAAFAGLLPPGVRMWLTGGNILYCIQTFAKILARPLIFSLAVQHLPLRYQLLCFVCFGGAGNGLFWCQYG